MDKKKIFCYRLLDWQFYLWNGYSISYGLPAGVIAYSSVCNSTSSLDCILLERISRIPVYLANKPLKTRAAKVLREVGKIQKSYAKIKMLNQ